MTPDKVPPEVKVIGAGQFESDPYRTPSSVIAGQRTCPECGLLATADVDAIAAASNLVTGSDQRVYARLAFYVCPTRHRSSIPYDQAMRTAGTLGELIDRLKDGSL